MGWTGGGSTGGLGREMTFPSTWSLRTTTSGQTMTGPLMAAHTDSSTNFYSPFGTVDFSFRPPALSFSVGAFLLLRSRRGWSSRSIVLLFVVGRVSEMPRRRQREGGGQQSDGSLTGPTNCGCCCCLLAEGCGLAGRPRLQHQTEAKATFLRRGRGLAKPARSRSLSLWN